MTDARVAHTVAQVLVTVDPGVINARVGHSVTQTLVEVDAAAVAARVGHVVAQTLVEVDAAAVAARVGHVVAQVLVENIYTGSASGSLTISASASGFAEVLGSASGSLTINGTASGDSVSVYGTASGTLSLGGSAAGIVSSSGSASGTLTLGGLASGYAPAGGLASGILSLSGLAFGTGPPPPVPPHGLLQGFCASTVEGDLILNGIPMKTSAWMCADLTPLWGPTDIRGEDRILPTASGVIPYKRRRASTVYSLDFSIAGFSSMAGVVTTGTGNGSEEFRQLEYNIDFLRQNVIDPRTDPNPDGTVLGELTMPSGEIRTAYVHVLGFTVNDRVSHMLQGVLDLSVPSGGFF